MKLPKIEKLPSVSYHAQVQIGGKRYSITEPTQKQVEREIAALKLKLKRAPEKSTAGTLGDAIDRYIESRENILSPSTIRGYREIRRNRFQGSMSKKVLKLDSRTLQAMIDAEAKICGPKTVKNAWGLVKAAIETETGERITVRLPQVPPSDRPFLDPEQIKIFIAAVHGTSIEIPALLALSSLRASEIAGLKWSDVDLKKRLIRVSGAAVRDSEYKLVEKKTNKNRSSARTVPIIDPLYNALSAVERKTGKVVALTANHIYGTVNDICTSVGLPKVGLHGLRHSFASLAYSLGIPEKITMEIGGWSDDRTMRKIYTHIAQQDKAHFEGKFTQFFEP